MDTQDILPFAEHLCCNYAQPSPSAFHLALFRSSLGKKIRHYNPIILGDISILLNF